MAEIPETPPLEYSESRQAMFDRCPRQWWYRYEGSWGGWQAGPGSDHHRMWLYGKASSLYLLRGIAVHEGLATLLHGDHAEVSAVVGSAREQIAKGVREAASWREGARWANKEFFTTDSIRGEFHVAPAIVEDLQDDVEDCIRTFCDLRGDGWLAEGFIAAVVRARQDDRLVDVEPLKPNFSAMKMNHAGIGSGEVPVWARPDLVIEHVRGRYAIIDWKTGEAPDVRTEMTRQLRTYGLKLSHEERIPPNCIDLHELYLPDGEWSGAAFSQEAHDSTLRELNERAKALIRLRGGLDMVQRDKCPGQPSESNCLYCPFTALCEDSHTAAGAS